MKHIPSDEQAVLVALLRDRSHGMSWREIVEVLLRTGSARAVWAEAGDNDLFGDAVATATEQARRDISAWQSSGLTFWSVLDSDYPARVRDIREAPPFLFARGQVRHGDVAVSIVGSRTASPDGLAMAGEVADVMTTLGITVVAGLAAGIDTAAHQATLARGGRTVAVIGTGINQVYPAANRDLQRIIGERGLLLSQFWPDAPPTRKNFPMRNAVMSGYGIATIVVEAGEHSGARIQARLAVEHGRPVILTKAVLAATEWGRALVGRPGVHQAESVADVVAIVERLRAWPIQVRGALDDISV